jgi:hypothetical protein
MKNTLDVIEETRKEAERVRANEVQHWHFLTSPLTSTAWDGDAYSTTAKTLIDLSAVFGVPAGVRAVLVRVIARDSASAANNALEFRLSPAGDATVFISVRPSGLPNDYWAEQTAICPCDANGDIYYSVAASGAGTMDVYIQILGWMY